MAEGEISEESGQRGGQPRARGPRPDGDRGEGLGTLFEKMGDVALLPPALAAWAPDTLFALTGLYLLLRMRS